MLSASQLCDLGMGFTLPFFLNIETGRVVLSTP